MAGTFNIGNLSFDGSVSTADQFSNGIDLINSSFEQAAWILRVSLAQGPLAVTLQVNMDPVGATLSGWQDVASTSIRVLDMTNSVFLDQTDADIESSKLRGGIVKGGSENVDLLLQYTAAPAQYRLRFQISSATFANIEWVLTVP